MVEWNISKVSPVTKTLYAPFTESIISVIESDLVKTLEGVLSFEQEGKIQLKARSNE